MTPREEQHVPGCNCDWDSDTERGYFRCYTDPRCAALNAEPNAHVAAPLRRALNAFLRASRGKAK